MTQARAHGLQPRIIYSDRWVEAWDRRLPSSTIRRLVKDVLCDCPWNIRETGCIEIVLNRTTMVHVDTFCN
jgi:hypothetical protein